MADQKNKANETEEPDGADTEAVNIQPSEPDADSSDEENAPGRTAGKAEGSREIVEGDLAEREGK